MELKTKMQMKKAFERAGDNKKELYRLLLVAEKLGLEWSSREMYGGGTSIVVYDNIDSVIEISMTNDGINLYFDDEYFTEDFKPSRIVYYSEETLAEIRNEEALYGYEMPHYYITKG